VGRLLAERATVGEALAARAALLERQARQLEALAAAVHERRTLDELARAVAADEPRIDLFHAALLVAKLDNPELDVAASTRDLDRLVADIAKRSADADETMKLATLNRVLFEELGFHGSRGDYYNRSNSYVNEVLDDREGIPITLSVVYMELARRLGLRVEGVGFPGHFLVRSLPAAGEPRWLDVFDRAAVRSRDDLARQLREQSGDELADEHLATVGPRAILVRMLSNLRGIATREGKQADVLRYLDATLAVDPLSVRDRLMRMVTAARLGRRETATEDAGRHRSGGGPRPAGAGGGGCPLIGLGSAGDHDRPPRSRSLQAGRSSHSGHQSGVRGNSCPASLTATCVEASSLPAAAASAGSHCPRRSRASSSAESVR
jgi:regulator of sirC expression with transglutaminase-like and TPR domain